MQYLCSYKGIHNGWQGLVNRGIRLVTNSIYSHSEISIGNPFEAVVPCFSSSGVDGGVRRKEMQLNPENWDIQPVPWLTEKTVIDWWSRNNGRPYDFAGVTRFALPYLARQHQTAWFCSEAAGAMLGFDEPWRLCPADIHSIVASMRKIEDARTN